MPVARRIEIAQMLERLDGPVAIEDSVYAFLEEHAPPPLYTFALASTILIDRLSKRIGPGLTLGIIAAPERLREVVAGGIAAGAWGAPGFAMEACFRWFMDGTVERLEGAKRQDAAARQALARQAFAGLAIRTHPSSYHLFVELPERIRAATIVEQAAALGIAITPASAFAVSAAHAPNAFRIGLANLDADRIEPVLSSIAALVGGASAKR